MLDVGEDVLLVTYAAAHGDDPAYIAVTRMTKDNHMSVINSEMGEKAEALYSALTTRSEGNVDKE